MNLEPELYFIREVMPEALRELYYMDIIEQLQQNREDRHAIIIPCTGYLDERVPFQYRRQLYIINADATEADDALWEKPIKDWYRYAGLDLNVLHVMDVPIEDEAVRYMRTRLRSAYGRGTKPHMVTYPFGVTQIPAAPITH